MNVSFWVDPICPWCWMTARWVKEVVEPQRNLTITWHPISLYEKNQPDSDNPFYEKMVHTNSLLRVAQSLEDTEGNEAFFKFYWEAGKRIHHDGDVFAKPETLLSDAGFATNHANAFNNEHFDTAIKERMNKGLALVGQDVGTPIISFTDTNGTERGIFGPVISELPTGAEGLKVWDAMTTLATMDGFWELKRTRTVQPNFGKKPQ